MAIQNYFHVYKMCYIQRQTECRKDIPTCHLNQQPLLHSEIAGPTLTLGTWF